MMPEIIYTVLTGDVVKSSSLSAKEREGPQWVFSSLRNPFFVSVR